MPWTNVRQGVQMLSEQVQQIIDALKGTPGRGQRFSLTNYSSPADYALTVQNLGQDGKALRINKADGTTVLEVDNDGVHFSSASIDINSTSSLSLPDGTAAAPALRFTSDPNTGLFHTTTTDDNTLRISANGTEQLAISPTTIAARGNTLVVDTATTRVGIGTASPGKALDVTGEARTSSTLTVTSGGLVVSSGGATITGATTLTGDTTVSSGSNLTLAGGALTLTGDVTTSAGRVILPPDTSNGHIDPELTFTGSTGTGLYSGATNTLSVTTNQVKRATFGDTGTLTLEAATSGHSLSVGGTTDLTGKLTLGTSGLESASGPLTLGSGPLTLTSGNVELTGGRLFLKQDTSGTNAQTPELAFYSADGTTRTTGLYSGADNTLALATGNAARLTVSNAGAAITGSLSTTAGLELGTASGVLKLPNGTATAPALTFSSDTDLGLYRVGAEHLGLTGALTASSTLTGNALAIGTTGHGFASDGAASAKSLNLNGGSLTNGGTLTATAFSGGTIAGTTGTFSGVLTASGGASVTGGVTLTNSALNLPAGAVGTPSLYLSTDTTTGLYRAGTNELAVAVSGTEALKVASTGVTTSQKLTVTTGGATLTGAVDGITTLGLTGKLTVSANGADITGATEVKNAALTVSGAGAKVLAPTDTAPVYSFTDAPTSGLWRETGGDVKLARAGTTRVALTGTGVDLTGTTTSSGALTVSSGGASITGTTGITGATTVTGPLTVTGDTGGTAHTATFGGQVLGPNGTASVPALSFSGDADTGVYRSNSNELSVAVGGAQGLTVDAARNLVAGGTGAYATTDTGGYVYVPGGTNTTPANPSTAYTGKYPLYYRTDNKQLYAYHDGAWNTFVAGSSGSSSAVDSATDVVLTSDNDNNNSGSIILRHGNGVGNQRDVAILTRDNAANIGGLLDVLLTSATPTSAPASGYGRLLVKSDGLYRQNDQSPSVTTKLVEVSTSTPATGSLLTYTTAGGTAFARTVQLGSTAANNFGQLQLFTDTTSATNQGAKLYLGNVNTANSLTTAAQLRMNGSLWVGASNADPGALAAGAGTFTGALSAASLADVTTITTADQGSDPSAPASGTRLYTKSGNLFKLLNAGTATQVVDLANATANTVLRGTGSKAADWGQVSAAYLATDAVTTAKLLDANVTTAKLATGAISQIWLVSGSYTATTSSTTLADYPEMSITFTSTGGDLLAFGITSADSTSNCVLQTALRLDAGADQFHARQSILGPGTAFVTMVGFYQGANNAPLTGVASGSHTIKIQWKTETAGTTLSNGGNRRLIIIELKR